MKLFQRISEQLIPMQSIELCRKYILQPVPKENPYLKREEITPYRLIEEINQSNQIDHNLWPSHDPAVEIFCDQCNKEITHHSHIKLDNQQLCPPCFSQLQSFPSTYTVQQKMDFPIIEPTWSAFQQLLLLKSIEKWGFGNWYEIRDYMEYFGVKFTEEQIEEHYNKYFLNEKTYYPKFSQVLGEKKIEYNQKWNNDNGNIQSLTMNQDEQKEILNQKLAQISNLNQQLQNKGQTEQFLSFSSQIIPGYNNLRKEFDTDFDHEAQKSLVTLQFRDDDLPQERQVKFKIIQDYNQRLKRRYQVQDFIIQHQLLDKRIQKDQQDKRSAYQKQSAEQLERLMKFNTFDVHNELVRRVALNKQLKSLIEGLRSLRRPSKSGKLQDMIETLKKRSMSSSRQKQRGKPRKMIHTDNTNKKQLSQSKKQAEWLKSLHIKGQDLKQIIRQAESWRDGQSFVYKGVEVSIIERR